MVIPGRGLCFLGKEGPFLKSCASSVFSWQGPLFSGKRGPWILAWDLWLGILGLEISGLGNLGNQAGGIGWRELGESLGWLAWLA